MPKQQNWDVIIVGGGPAGSNAAMVLARAHRKVLLIDEGKQRNLKSHGMHNFLTRDGILPPDFLGLVHEELARYSLKIIKAKAESAVREEDGSFTIKASDGSRHCTRKLLLATGVTDNIPDVPGMQELWGCAVHHCPFCDGWEATGQIIGLYSQKFNGFGMALALRPYSKNVILFTDGAHYLRAAQRRELQAHGVRIVTTRVTKLVAETQKLEAVLLKTGEEIPCQTMFVNHGYKTNNELFLSLNGRCDKKGAAIINRHQECNIPGLYIAGDAALDAHFVIVAAAQGARAGIAIHEALLKEDNAKALAVNEAVVAGEAA